jgi:hypothetical protein
VSGFPLPFPYVPVVRENRTGLAGKLFYNQTPKSAEHPCCLIPFLRVLTLLQGSRLTERWRSPPSSAERHSHLLKSCHHYGNISTMAHDGPPPPALREHTAASKQSRTIPPQPPSLLSGFSRKLPPFRPPPPSRDSQGLSPGRGEGSKEKSRRQQLLWPQSREQVDEWLPCGPGSHIPCSGVIPGSPRPSNAKPSDPVPASFPASAVSYLLSSLGGSDRAPPALPHL